MLKQAVKALQYADIPRWPSRCCESGRRKEVDSSLILRGDKQAKLYLPGEGRSTTPRKGGERPWRGE